MFVKYWTKRHFLLNIAAGAAAAVTGRSAQSEGAFAGDPGSIARDLFGDPGGAGAIGRLYLAQHPEEADVGTLLRLIGISGSLAPAAARRRIAAQRTADFCAGDLATIDGWLLARTEARVCALAALA